MRHVLCWGYFAFIWTRLVEVVTWQARSGKTLG